MSIVEENDVSTYVIMFQIFLKDFAVAVRHIFSGTVHTVSMLEYFAVATDVVFTAAAARTVCW